MTELMLKCIEYLGGPVCVIALCKWLYSRDAAAADRCLEVVCNFRNGLEKFGNHVRNPHRHPDTDLPKLLELKTILQELNHKKRGLLFKPRSLSQPIQESLKLFSRLDILSPGNKPHMIAAELTVEWGIPTAPPYEAMKLVELQKILEKSFLIRWFCGVFSWVKPLLDKVPFRIRIERKSSSQNK